MKPDLTAPQRAKLQKAVELLAAIEQALVTRAKEPKPQRMHREERATRDRVIEYKLDLASTAKAKAQSLLDMHR